MMIIMFSSLLCLQFLVQKFLIVWYLFYGCYQMISVLSCAWLNFYYVLMLTVLLCLVINIVQYVQMYAN